MDASTSNSENVGVSSDDVSNRRSNINIDSNSSSENISNSSTVSHVDVPSVSAEASHEAIVLEVSDSGSEYTSDSRSRSGSSSSSSSESSSGSASSSPSRSESISDDDAHQNDLTQRKKKIPLPRVVSPRRPTPRRVPPPRRGFKLPSVMTLFVALFIISFVPLLFFREPGEPLHVIYHGAYVSRDAKRSHHIASMMLKIRQEKHKLESKLSSLSIRSEAFERLKAKAMSVTRELLKEKSRSMILEKEGKDAHQHAKDTSGVHFQRMKSLNATFLGAMNEMKKRLDIAKAQLAKQVQISERLETQLESVRSGDGDAVLREDREKAAALESTVQTLKAELNATKQAYIRLVHGTDKKNEVGTDKKSEVGTHDDVDYKPTPNKMGDLPPWRTQQEPAASFTPDASWGRPDAGSWNARAPLVRQQPQQGYPYAGAPAAVNCDKQRFMFNMDIPGSIISGKPVRSARSCRSMCVANMECEGWSYRRVDGKCFLKSSIGVPSGSTCCIAGVICQQ